MCLFCYIIIMPKGVDYDARCKKYRARLTRNGCVYHLGYFSNQDDALKARKHAERQYSNGSKIKYVHSYSTSSLPVETENDYYLHFLAFNDSEESDSPERSLRLAVLIQAVKDSLTDKRPAEQKNARLWFRGKIESEPTYSFEEVCEILGLSSGFVLRGIKKANRNKAKALQMLGRRLVRSTNPDITND